MKIENFALETGSMSGGHKERLLCRFDASTPELRSAICWALLVAGVQNLTVDSIEIDRRQLDLKSPDEYPALNELRVTFEGMYEIDVPAVFEAGNNRLHEIHVGDEWRDGWVGDGETGPDGQLQGFAGNLFAVAGVVER